MLTFIIGKIHNEVITADIFTQEVQTGTYGSGSPKKTAHFISPDENADKEYVNIRPKIIFVVLPLIIVPLVLAGFVSYLSARNGITAVASGFLRFKSQTLVDYMEGQWALLTDNNLESDAAYLSAAEGAMNAFAANLIRSDSEIILALDEDGAIVMSAPRQDSRLGPYPEETISGAARAVWRDTVMIGGERRVAHVDYFEPWGWTVLVTESWATFYRPVQRTAYLIGLIGAASLVLALLVLIIAAGRITKPLESMVTVIDGVMETMDLSRRVEIYYTDETGKLGHSFNRMAGSLEKANADIKNFALRAVFAHRQAEEARKMEKNLRTLFAKYVPQSVIDANIERQGQNLREGQNQFVSVLMSDIRGFTTISESMTPDILVDSLNRYFEVMVDVIDRRGGITDKYIGDAIMALFGVPVKQEDDVLRSVYAGLEMLESLDDFNREQAKRGRRPFSIGIGLHYGVVTAGNIGSDKKMDYTVMGETVNTASRLEGLTKYYGIPMIVSETVKRRTEEQVVHRLLDRVMVKGSSNALPIYSVSKHLSPESKEVWDAFADGQKKYYDMDFPGARKSFQTALKAYPDDRPSQIFLERTLEYLQKPPESDWDGTFRHETK